MIGSVFGRAVVAAGALVMVVAGSAAGAAAQPRPPVLAFHPAPFDYGQVRVGQQKARTFTLANAAQLVGLRLVGFLLPRAAGMQAVQSVPLVGAGGFQPVAVPASSAIACASLICRKLIVDALVWRRSVCVGAGRPWPLMAVAAQPRDDLDNAVKSQASKGLRQLAAALQGTRSQVR